MKIYNIQYGIGKAKYLVNIYDGVTKHSDGSQFWGVKIAHNKRVLRKIISVLIAEGYSKT